MIGQGRPHHALWRLPRTLPWIAAMWVCAAVALAMPRCGRAADLDSRAMRLRLEWGGGDARLWRGTVSVSSGVLGPPTALGIEADEPGSIWLDGAAIRIDGRSQRPYDGFDFDVEAPADARLVIELETRDARQSAERIELPLSEVVERPFNRPLDDQRNRLVVRRAPGDKLRVRLARDSLVVEPGETLEIEVQPHRIDAPPGAPLKLSAALTPPRGGRERLWSSDHECGAALAGELAPPIVLSVPAPTEEGVYDLQLTLERRALPTRLSLRRLLAERRVQFVVVGRKRPERAPAPPPTEVVAEVDPASPPWWERLAGAALLPGLAKGPLGSGDAKPLPHALGALVQLPSQPPDRDTSWEAYPLPVQRPGQPHILEVEYPTDAPQSLGISIVEPNSSGAIAPVGLDSGVYVDDESVENPPRLAKHRLVFWPRTRTPLVLLTNQRRDAPAVFGRIRVLGPKTPVVPGLTRDGRGAAQLPRAVGPDEPANERLLAAYYDRPLFAENFSASEGVDSWTGRSLDDWVTFHEGALRLVEYLHYAGYNGLMLSAMADGSAIYPSAHLQPTPRYDSGIFFDSAQDPVRKDVLELLFRLFDREGLRLVPALQFATPLPELEAARRAGVPGVELVNADGAPWLVRHSPRNGLAPYYNPLNPRVERAVLALIEEAAQRYAAHPSFGGLALQLSADSYVQLPGEAWGCDDETLGRFARDRKLAADGDRAALVDAVRGPRRDEWLRWRAEQLHAFHRRLQAGASQARGQPTRLYLTASGMFEQPELEPLLRPALPRTTSLEAVALGLGIDFNLLRGQDDVLLLRPARIAPLTSLADAALNLELNQAAEIDRPLRDAPQTGSLFFHEPQQSRLASFEAKSPFRDAYAWLVTQTTPSGAANRARFVHSIATLDAAAMFEGGWLLPLGQEDALRDLAIVYRRLPAERFETLAASSPPLVIRTLVRPDGAYFYVVNDSPWPASLSVDVRAPAGCTVDSLSPDRALPELSASARPQRWTIDLAPYDLVAGKFSSADVQLLNPVVKLEGQVANRLTARVRELGQRVDALKRQRAAAQLPNAGFEAAVAEVGLIPHWSTGDAPDAQAEVAAGDAFSGNQCAQLRSLGSPASLVSDPIPVPATGRVWVLARLRLPDGAPQPVLRLALAGKLRGEEYLRYAPVGAGDGASPLKSEWVQYKFRVADLPLEGLDDLRVRFDLLSAGEVWIDDIELREFSDSEINELQVKVMTVSYKLQNGDVGDCVRLLDGYWPRYLESTVSLDASPAPHTEGASLPATPPAPTPSPAPPPNPRKPGVIDRLKQALPSFMR